MKAAKYSMKDMEIQAHSTRVGMLRLPPMRALFLAMLIGLAGFGGSLWYSLRQPWLGLTFEPASDGIGLVIRRVDARGAGAGILSPGDRLLSIAGTDGAWMQLRSRDLIDDPDEHPHFSGYNLFLERQSRLSRILRSEVVRFRLGDGREVRIQPLPNPPWRSLSGRFWICQAFAFLTLMISTAVWSLQRQPLTTRLLLISGIGLFIGAVSASLYLGRELALDGEAFRWLSTANFSGNRLFAVAGLALLCIYPDEVVPRSWVSTLATLESGYLFNLIGQWLEPPVHAYYFDFLLLASLAVIVSLRAWLVSRDKPLHRATLKVLLLPILLSVALVMGVYVLPTIVSGAPLMDVSGSYMLLLIMYAGLAFGVARYRLFNIERWWVRSWLWFLIGMAIMGLDFLVISLLHWSPEVSLVVSLLLVSWLYFPLRQWFWERLLHRRSLPMETYLSELVAHFIKPGRDEEDERFWKNLLHRAFLPVSMDVVASPVNRVYLSEDGTRLRVPFFETTRSLELRLPDRGSRLFDQEDAKLAQSLFDMARRARAQRQAYQLGVEDERRRIMRDLHDDVGGRLLSLVHSSRDEEASRLAREALDSLREVIYFTLEGGSKIALGDLLGRWRAQLRERLERAGVRLLWSWDAGCDGIMLEARDALSLSRILYEGTSNALCHAEPRRISIEGRLNEHELVITITNDGAAHPAYDTGRSGFGGKGMHNIRERAEEMGGKAEFRQEGDRFIVHLYFPLAKTGLLFEAIDAEGSDTRGS